MKIKCDKCTKPATIHLTEIVEGQKTERHLCEDCAATEGITVKADVPISQLLEEFILQGSSEQRSELACDVCGTTFQEFQEHALLGCPRDYDVFREPLTPILERSHEGATEHIGKVPSGADSDQKKQTELLRVRAELRSAVNAEDYERAAALRDQLKDLENP